jgi:hypothetical protein
VIRVAVELNGETAQLPFHNEVDPVAADLELGLDEVATGDDLTVYVPLEVGVEAGCLLGDSPADAGGVLAVPDELTADIVGM